MRISSKTILAALFVAALLSGCAASNGEHQAEQAANTGHEESACSLDSFGASMSGARLLTESPQNSGADNIKQGIAISSGVLPGVHFADQNYPISQVGILYLDRSEFVAFTKYEDKNILYAPHISRPSENHFSVTTGTTASPAIEVTFRGTLKQSQIEKIICAANDFWTSTDNSDINVDQREGLLSMLTVFNKIYAKDAGGPGVLKNSAAKLSNTFWNAVREAEETGR